MSHVFLFFVQIIFHWQWLSAVVPNVPSCCSSYLTSSSGYVVSRPHILFLVCCIVCKHCKHIQLYTVAKCDGQLPSDARHDINAKHCFAHITRTRRTQMELYWQHVQTVPASHVMCAWPTYTYSPRGIINGRTVLTGMKENSTTMDCCTLVGWVVSWQQYYIILVQSMTS